MTSTSPALMRCRRSTSWIRFKESSGPPRHSFRLSPQAGHDASRVTRHAGVSALRLHHGPACFAGGPVSCPVRLASAVLAQQRETLLYDVPRSGAHSSHCAAIRDSNSWRCLPRQGTKSTYKFQGTRPPRFCRLLADQLRRDRVTLRNCISASRSKPRRGVGMWYARVASNGGYGVESLQPNGQQIQCRQGPVASHRQRKALT